MLLSGVQQSDSVIYVFLNIYHMPHIFSHYGLLQVIENSSWCYTSRTFVCFVLAAPHSSWDLSSLIRDGTLALGSESRVLTTGPAGNTLFIYFMYTNLYRLIPNS